LTATSVEGCRHAITVGVSAGVGEAVDGVALEAEPEVGVDVGGDADVGVFEEFLDGDEFHALLQEQRGAGVLKVVEADVADHRRDSAGQRS
jgi:hypothetical protein